MTIFDIISEWEPFDQGESDKYLFNFYLPFEPSKKQSDVIFDWMSELGMEIDSQIMYGYPHQPAIRIIKGFTISFNLK